MTFSDLLRPVKPLDDGVIRVLGLSSPALTYPRSLRGEYLRAIREALGLTAGSAHRVLDIGLAAYTGLERGSCVFADRATWALVELVLIDTAGAAWCGEVAAEKVWIAARTVGAVEWPRPDPVGAPDFLKASQYVTFAAALQHQTVKRGILSRLAGDLALAAGNTEDAVKLARAGFVTDIGPRPEWLETGLQMLIAEAVTTAPRAAAEAVS